MCGLIAIHSPGRPVRSQILARGQAQIAHRGPDAQHLWIAPDGRVGLGHARLRVIDLVTGDQPLVSEDERLRVIVNGELHDHEQIRRGLERRGHTLRTRSDSEVALHLYEELGTDCLTQLRGQFAIVLWDARSSLLFAARTGSEPSPCYTPGSGTRCISPRKRRRSSWPAFRRTGTRKRSFSTAISSWTRTGPCSQASARCLPATISSPKATRSVSSATGISTTRLPAKRGSPGRSRMPSRRSASACVFHERFRL